MLRVFSHSQDGSSGLSLHTGTTISCAVQCQ